VVAHLIRLRWALLVNGLRRSPWQLVGVILGGVYVAGLLVLAAAGLTALGVTAPAQAAPLAVIAGSLVVLGWAVVPVLLTGMDGSMEPQRFALYPIKHSTLATGLTLAGFVGVPGLATLLFLELSSLAYVRSLLALLINVVAAVGAALMAQLLARTGIAVAGMVATRRGVRESASVLVFLPLFFIGPLAGLVAANADALLQVAHTAAVMLGFTPFGSFLGIAAAVAQGKWLLAGAYTLLSAGYLTLAWWAHLACLRRAVVTPPRVVSSAAAKGLGWIGRFPATSWGAVAGRCLTYWFKDPRYAASLAMLPAMVVLILVLGPLTQGSAAHGSVVIIALVVPAVLGFSISADISYDSTAFSLHLLSGVRGMADRVGRAVALWCVALPLTVVVVIVASVLAGDPAWIPALIGTALGLLLCSTGLASAASARWTYAVPLPGESPFKTPPGAGARMAVTQLALFAGIIATALPTLVLFAITLFTSSVLFSWITLVVGLVLGAVVAVLGVRIGARWYDQRGPELMQAVELNA